MYKIIFKSENLDFVNVSTNLIDEYLIMMNDPKIQGFVSKETHIYNREGEVEWINSKLENKDSVYSIIERTSGKFVGNIELMNIENGTSEIGICLTPNFQDKHYGTEALKRVIQYGFNELNLDEIYLKVFSNNARAIHCYKKLGFIEYKITKNVKIMDNEEIDDVYMKLKK